MQWTSEESFRAADHRRCGPLEVEFGSRWFGASDEDPWRVVWLEATAELVAVQFDGPVNLLAVAVDRPAVERGLRGWWQVCGHRGSLPWVEHRAADLASKG